MLNPKKNDRPLSYPSTKVLLQYLEPSTRFFLTTQAPSLRVPEKIAPLHLNHLCLKRSGFDVNGAKFEIGIIRKSVKYKLLAEFEKDNEAGGLNHDLDEYGAEDQTSKGVMFPGDVQIINSALFDQNPVENPDWLMAMDAKYLRNLRKKPQTEVRRQEIEELEAKLFPWRNRKNSFPDCYQRYIQVIIFETGRFFKTEYLEYNSKKLYEAMKYLNVKFFGGRKLITTRELKINLKESVLRLPVGLRIRPTHKMIIGGNVADVITSLSHVLEDYLSLDTVTINDYYRFVEPPNNQHSLITTTKSLEVKDDRRPIVGWFEPFLSTKNPRVTVKMRDPRPEHLLELARRIIRDQREIGTQYSFGLDYFTYDNMLNPSMLDEFKANGFPRKLEDNKKKGSDWFTDYVLPVTRGKSELHIYCKRREDYEPDNRPESEYVAYFNVVPFFYRSLREELVEFLLIFCSILLLFQVAFLVLFCCIGMIKNVLK